jgi:aldehyde dehydrogenase (NAD+)
VQSYIRKGLEEGAEVLVGGEGHPRGLESGCFVKPTVFVNVKNDMTIAQEEIFGPVLAIIAYRDEDEAVRIANDTVYGLAGAVWSKDEARAQRVARRMRAGQIDINGGAFNMNAPFGGYKQSGHGREAGVYGLAEFLEYKSLQLKG